MSKRDPIRKLDHSSTIIIVILLISLFRIFFYHSGHGVIQESWREGPRLFLRLMDGHVFDATACTDELDRPSGNDLRYIAIGPELSLHGKNILAPLMIRCEWTGWNVDYFEPLP